MRYYTTLNDEEINLINWSNLYEQKETVRWSLDRQHFLVSFDEIHNEYFLNFNGLEPMTKQEAIELMETEAWLVIEE